MMLNRLHLLRMDWGIRVDPDSPIPPQVAAALAQAARYYLNKYGTDPTRAWIHQSQVSGPLALAADNLGIEIIEISTPYNVNHIMLSCEDTSKES